MEHPQQQFNDSFKEVLVGLLVRVSSDDEDQLAYTIDSILEHAALHEDVADIWIEENESEDEATESYLKELLELGEILGPEDFGGCDFGSDFGFYGDEEEADEDDDDPWYYRSFPPQLPSNLRGF